MSHTVVPLLLTVVWCAGVSKSCRFREPQPLKKIRCAAQAEQMERDFDALAKDLQANLTSMGCINKDVRSSLPYHSIIDFVCVWLLGKGPSRLVVLTGAELGERGCILRCVKRGGAH